jgi:hypothetical protein
MPYIPQSSNDSGLYIPTTTVYDQINSANISDELKQLFIVLYQNTNNIAIALNQKDSAIYDLNKFVSGQGWFVPPPGTSANMQLRPGYRKVLYLTSLLPGVTTVPHGIHVTGTYSFTLIQITANDTVGFNYYTSASSGPGVDISIVGNNVNIVVTNNTGITFNVVEILLEWLEI